MTVSSPHRFSSEMLLQMTVEAEENGLLPADDLPGDDFPAAHSMDTTWFAADAEGMVGVFHSDEDGLMPTRCEELGLA